VAGASPSRVASTASPGPSPVASDQTLSEAEIARVEALLLDHVSFSTPQGGSVMDTSQAANWLRNHAGNGIKVTRLERGTQTLMLQVLTDGWPTRDPIQQGQLTFSLRRYDANGRPDEEQGGWKIDVIEAL
jgi:hypothetical protein